MESTNQNNTTNPPFCEFSPDTEQESQADYENKDCIRHYRDMPIEDRSHEAWEDMVDLIQMLWHNKQYQDHELYLRQKQIDMQQECNVGLLQLSSRLARALVVEDGNKDRLNEIKADYANQFLSVVKNITLNNNTFSMTRMHMHQIFTWYDNPNSIYFRTDDTYTGEGEGGPGVHQFNFMEIVRRKYTTKRGTTKYDEVLLVQERKFLCDVVTMVEIRRCTKNLEDDTYVKPKFVWINDIESFNPRRYFMNENEVTTLHADLFSIG